MKKLVLVFSLLATPAFAQVTTAPAVQPTTGAPTEDEIKNAYGICQSHRYKGAWQSGYETCDAVQKAIAALIDTSHQQTVLDVAKRLGK
jgi:hypothetical protein